MLHRRMLTLWIVLIVALAACHAQPAAADVWVNQLTLSRHGVFTELTVRTPGRVLCNHFIEEPKHDKPFRVVLDLCGAIHRLDRKNFADLPAGVIIRIRTSQYATTPQNVVRVVLDLGREVTYKVDIKDEAIVIALVTPNEPEFETWVSAPMVDELVVEHAVGMPEAAPAPPVRTAPDAFSIREHKTAPSAFPDQPVVKEIRAQEEQPSEPKVVETPPPAKVIFERPIPPEDSEPEITIVEQIDQSPPPVSIPEPEEPAERVVIEKPRVEPVIQYPTPIGPPWLVETPIPANDTEEKTVPETPLELQIPQSAVLAESPDQPEDTPEAVDQIEVSAEQAVAPTEIEPEQPKVIAEKPEELSLFERMRRKFLGSPGEEQTEVDASADSAALSHIRSLPGAAEPTVSEPEEELAVTEEAPSREVDRAELESKIASVDPLAVSPGSLYAATERKIGQAAVTVGKGKRVPIDPKRREIEYMRAERRDPFDPLVEGQRSGLWTTALPRVDALRLVGILDDYDGSIALFEDMEGYGYILHEGDPVKHGYLKAIGDHRALFEVDDYGWVHTIVLEMRADARGINFDYANEDEDE